MAKYINADDFIKNLDTIENPDSKFAPDEYIDGFSDGISATMKVAEEATHATDAVEVVRCKECKHCIHVPTKDCDGEICYCRRSLLHAPEAVDCNNFCSYGERKSVKTMTEYISRDETINTLLSVTNDKTCPLHIGAQIEQLLECIPAADVSPVVMCKDCKYAFINDYAKASGMVFCRAFATRSDGTTCIRQQNDFCNYGERKDENEV